MPGLVANRSLVAGPLRSVLLTPCRARSAVVTPRLFHFQAHLRGRSKAEKKATRERQKAESKAAALRTKQEWERLKEIEKKWLAQGGQPDVAEAEADADAEEAEGRTSEEIDEAADDGDGRDPYDFSHIRNVSRVDASISVRKCERALGYEFKNKLLCYEALNCSYQAVVPHPENPTFYRIIPTSQHLAILGDKLLDQRLALAWYRRNVVQYSPQAMAGWTRLMTRVPTNQNLTKVALQHNFHRIIFAEASASDSTLLSERIGGTTVEALIAAVYLDGGEEKLEDLMRRWRLYDEEPVQPVSDELWDLAFEDAMNGTDSAEGLGPLEDDALAEVSSPPTIVSAGAPRTLTAHAWAYCVNPTAPVRLAYHHLAASSARPSHPRWALRRSRRPYGGGDG
ncbi:hypothetical protein F4780DRAFT_69879 [Xylariomycetidae sp. FL0641]|nr:hypothetical protein F4780DRAFT_69879 [Xylariomycetidae sp. FL0641]